MQTIKPVTPPAPYVGGKRLLAKEIIKLINTIPHKSYIEPFFGMGGVFFRRDIKPKCEIINDLNGEVVNFFRVLQRHFNAFIQNLKFHIASRDDFNRLKNTHSDYLTDIERASRFYYLQKNAFGGKVIGQNFGVSIEQGSKFNISKVKKSLNAIYKRIESVTIENLPYYECIKRYDKPTTLFYLDPPYWGTEDYYGKELFSSLDFDQLAKLLSVIKGKFILSINDTPEIRNIFKNFKIQEVSLNYSLSKNSTKKARELLITNFN